MPNKEKEIANIGTMIGQGKPLTEVRNRWEAFVRELAAGGVPVDINAVVQDVMQAAHSESTKDLQFYTDKVRAYNNLKKQIRDYIGRLRGEMQQTYTGGVTEKIFGLGPDGKVTVDQGADIATRDELEEYIKKLEDQLATVGDDAQLANVDLQNMLQKQQQIMQMMSNISKVLHDTALAVIRKMG